MLLLSENTAALINAVAFQSFRVSYAILDFKTHPLLFALCHVSIAFQGELKIVFRTNSELTFICGQEP